MNASREAARTSRVSAPMASPRAANPTAPAASASTQSGKRPQSRSTNRPRPTSISRQAVAEHSAARPAFSTSSAVRDTRPRTRRGNAFSSRSSASVPEASSSVMNISDTATASATANELSELRPPSSERALTLIGSPTTASTSSEKERFSRASSAKLTTRSTSSRWGDPGGSSLCALRRIRSARWRPRMLMSWPRNV